MLDPFEPTFRLIPPEQRGPAARGLSLDAEGLVLGPFVKLIYPVGSGRTRTYVARSLEELDVLLHAAYHGPVPIARVASGLRTVAAALNRGDLVTANIAAVLLAMPDLSDAEAARRLACANALLKYNDAENRDRLGRWTAGGAAPEQVADAGPGREVPDPADREKAREWRGLGAKELAEFKGSFPPDSGETEQHVYAMIYIIEGGKKKRRLRGLRPASRRRRCRI